MRLIGNVIARNVRVGKVRARVRATQGNRLPPPTVGIVSCKSPLNVVRRELSVLGIQDIFVGLSVKQQRIRDGTELPMWIAMRMCSLPNDFVPEFGRSKDAMQ